MAREGLMDDTGIDFEEGIHDCNMCKHQKLVYENGVAYAECEYKFCEFEMIDE